MKITIKPHHHARQKEGKYRTGAKRKGIEDYIRRRKTTDRQKENKERSKESYQPITLREIKHLDDGDRNR